MLNLFFFSHTRKGLAGFYPIAPQTYMKAWRNRKRIAEEEAAKQTEAPETP